MRKIRDEYIYKFSDKVRRICYEFVRFYAKVINVLLDGNDKLEVFMLGDKENLHCVVGVTGDESGRFKQAVYKFNEGKREELIEIEEAKKNLKEKNCIEYFKRVAQILKNKNIDAQGFFEYIRAVVENEGIKIEKIWKEDKAAPEKRYERCIIFELDGETYLIYSIEQCIIQTEKEDLDTKIFVFNSAENVYPYYGV